MEERMFQMVVPFCKAALTKVVKFVQDTMRVLHSYTLQRIVATWNGDSHCSTALCEVALEDRTPSPGCATGPVSRGLGLFFPTVLPPSPQCSQAVLTPWTLDS